MSADVAGEALGLEVTGAEAADAGATPQCAYTYDSTTGHVQLHHRRLGEAVDSLLVAVASAVER